MMMRLSHWNVFDDDDGNVVVFRQHLKWLQFTHTQTERETIDDDDEFDYDYTRWDWERNDYDEFKTKQNKKKTLITFFG